MARGGVLSKKARKTVRRPATRRRLRESTPKAKTANAKPVGKTAAEDAFVKSLVANGEAACVGPDGKLPAGATHELIQTEDGEVKAIRRRFSAY
jgi:hypothetical protein